MALDTNLVSYWKLDESTGDAADSVGGNTGTNVNTVTYSAGKIVSGAVFNGTTQRFTVGTSLLSAYTGVTVAGWVKLDVNNAFMRFVSKTDDSTYNQMIRLTDTGKLAAHVYTTTETTITGGTTLSTATWYHFAYTYDGANINLYLNGVSDATAVAKTGTLATKTNTVSIGSAASVTAYEFLDGMLDEVGIWNRALSASEISMLYNGGTGSQYTFTDVTNLTAYPFADGGDASIYASDGSSWATARNATTGTLRKNYVQATLSGATRFIERTFLTIDTSLLPDSASIVSATLKIYIKSVSNANSPSYRLYDSTHTDTIIAGDYDLMGTTEQSASYLTSPTASAYASFTLNAAGLASINKTGYTKFSIREAAYDLANSQPAGSNILEVGDLSEGYQFSPKLEIVYAEALTVSPPALAVTATLNVPTLQLISALDVAPPALGITATLNVPTLSIFGIWTNIIKNSAVISNQSKNNASISNVSKNNANVSNINKS